MPSMCTVERLTPPIAALVPNARWIVPSAFSSSRMFPVSRADGFVPMPSSAIDRPCSPPASRVAASHSPTAPSKSTIRPPDSTTGTGSSSSPKPPNAPSNTIVPSPEVSNGAMNASPAGRFPNAPTADRSPSSEMPDRPPSSIRRSVPPGAVTRHDDAAESCAASHSPARLSSP